MLSCPYCSAEVDDEYNFCSNCERQIKCMKCGSYLIPDKTKCLICGTPIIDYSLTPNNSLNEYTFDEERTDSSYQRHVSLRFSDNALEKAGRLLPGYIFPVPSNEIEKPNETEKHKVETVAELTSGEEPSEEPTSLPEDISDTREVAKENYKKVVRWIFRHDDELQIKLRDFKGGTRKDQQRRFVLLYVGGYKHYFNQPVPNRQPILALAKEKNLWDTTFSHSITKMEQEVLLKNKEGGLELSPSGESEVEQILSELLDDSVPKGYDYWTTKTSTKKTTTGRKSKKNIDKTGLLVEQWNNVVIDLYGFDVRQLENAKSRQKVQFGLWVLKNKVGVEQASLDAVVEYLTHKFPKMGGTKKSLKNSVTGRQYVG